MSRTEKKGASAAKASRDSTVLLVGGKGSLRPHYRQVVEARGFSLRHFEQRIPAAARKEAGKVAMVIIMVTMVSHPLRDHARELAGGAKIVYLKSASVSALRDAVSST